MTQQPRVPAASKDDQRKEGLKRVVSDWYIANEAAKRYDRNLLQYGGAMAAIVGVFGGSGGVFAIAISVQQAEFLPLWLIWADLAIGSILFVMLGILLLYSLLRRRTCENEAEKSLKQIIAEDYKRFLPGAEAE
ncbi:MAG: hypothetical protein HY666_02985 [Chloroflexi bacterium]|nr:hypothetical protein [Chloroflexota bacterium]